MIYHEELNNHTAYLRNNLCVVKYEPIKVFSDDAKVISMGLGGEARGDSVEDQNFQIF